MTIFNQITSALRAILNQLTATPTPALAGVQFSEALHDPPNVWTPDPNEQALSGPIRAPHLGYQCEFDPNEAFKARIRVFDKLRKRLGLKPITLHDDGWEIGHSKKLDYSEAVVAHLEVRMRLAERVVAFNSQRETIGLQPIQAKEDTWQIGDVEFVYYRKKIREFEAHMQAIQRLYPQIEALANRLIAISRSRITYLEAGFRLHCGGHTYRYTSQDVAAAEQEVEGHIHRHTLPTRNHQRVKELNARIHALTKGAWLPEPMPPLELTTTHIVYQGTSVPLGDEAGINRVVTTLETRLSTQEGICQVVAGLQTLTEQTMAALQRFIALQPNGGKDQKWMTVNNMLFREDGFTATLNGRVTNLAYTRANLARLENELRRFQAELTAAETAKATTPAVTAKPKGGSNPLSAALSSALRPAT